VSTSNLARLEEIAVILSRYCEEIEASGEAGFGGDDAALYENIFDHAAWLRAVLASRPTEIQL
jgi:hypothetical protein